MDGTPAAIRSSQVKKSWVKSAMSTDIPALETFGEDQRSVIIADVINEAWGLSFLSTQTRLEISDSQTWKK